MLKLKVTIDSTWVDLLVNQGKEHYVEKWNEYVEAKGLHKSFYQALSVPDGDIENDTEQFNKIKSYIVDQKLHSIRNIEKFFPEIEDPIEHDLNVVLLPYGKINFGIEEGTQIFSLSPEAHEVETNLFLTHVFYHEISSINNTDWANEAERDFENLSNYKYLIQLLIRNEGIGNYAILKDLMNFNDEHPTYNFNYFTYANKINDDFYIKKSFELLYKLFSFVDEENFNQLLPTLNHSLKDKGMPLINVIGIYMARRIAEYYGEDVLKNIYKVESTKFFELFISTNDKYVEFVKTLGREDGIYVK
ncbi:hypothetical protein [Pontibacillus marinus]|uniref:DUF2268 domain-containing protein n=1 Tax=Pontibacillus marinus BH030004 = DSM 16465 TaxID=1385511 RepID=A0A0A5GEP7_9BACI|nr:hypothetical protein [Pontibacillus marinus]KGX89693.1 hypothetical protein N783_04745 [Pontibacillus marinus BH030004 = DSM 16465]